VRRERLRSSLALLLACLTAAGSATAAPITMERKLGEEFVAEARRGLPMIKDYRLNRFISGIGNRYVDTLGKQPFDYQFFVINDSSINAFAVPGGKIFINAGLVSRSDNEGELAGVMGHEVAHSHAHHSVRQQEKAAVANYAGLLGVFLMVINPVLGQAALSASMGQQLKYQRDFEREADFIGIDLSKKAGYDPAAMLGLLRKLYEEQQAHPTLLPPYFMSHPLTGERMAYLEAALGKNEWQVERRPPTMEFERMQATARAHSETRRQAVPQYERRLAEAKTDEERADALELIGLLMVQGEEYEGGLGYLEKAEVTGREVDRELGRAYLREGMLDKAEPRLRRVVAKSPGDWDAAGDLGELLYQQGHYDKASRSLQRSHDLHPYRPHVMEALARAMDKVGRRGAGFYYLAGASELRSQAQQAKSYYARAAESMPADDPLRAELDVKMGALVEAEPRIPDSHQRPGRFHGEPVGDLER